MHGVRVIEVGQFMAAPFAGMQLADLGADVIKIENPRGGDPMRASGPFVGDDPESPAEPPGGASSGAPDEASAPGGESSPFLRLNRNKRSIGLDLKSPDGRDVFRRLLTRSDVLIENLRPGALAKLDLDYESVHPLNPRLVYVSASGWGQDGPDSARAGLDIMAQARAGLMSITGHPGGDPAKVGVPVCDLVCGLYAAMGAMAALTSRQRSGTGQHVDVSLLEAGVSLAIWEAGKFWGAGEVGVPLGSAHQNTAPYQAVRTADGWATIGAVTPKTWVAFCATLGLDDLADDPRFADAYRRQQRRDELIPVIEASTRDFTTRALVTALEEVGVPCAPIADYGEVFTDPHLEARGYFWDAPHPTLGPVRQLGSPVRLSRTPARRDAAGPALGADTSDVLAELDLDTDEVADLEEAGVIRRAGRPREGDDGRS